jgi:broad specificity phosphatase PhoE
MCRTIFLSLVFGAVPWTVSAASPIHHPAAIILIRHAEKPEDPGDVHLSQAGVQRAEELVSFITTDTAMARLGIPVAIFATKTAKDGNGQRTQETVAPLSRRLGVPVQTPFRTKDYRSLAELIFGDTAYAGKTILVCWNHERIPQLATALGVRPEPPKWKDDVYDRVYVISYPHGKAVLKTLHYGGH